MPKRLLYLVPLLFLWSSLSLRASPPIGAVVQTWHYDAQANTITLRIVNVSQKDITAYNISLTVRYADGTTNFSEMTDDFLPLMASVQTNQHDGNGTFTAGTSRDKIIPETKSVKDISAIVDVVAYADHTADVANERAFSHLVVGRKEVVLATQQANQVIKDAMTTPNPKDAAVKELRRLTEVAKASGASLTEMTLRGLAQNAEASDLAALIKDGEGRIAFYTPHLQLVKAVQP